MLYSSKIIINTKDIDFPKQKFTGVKIQNNKIFNTKKKLPPLPKKKTITTTNKKSVYQSFKNLFNKKKKPPMTNTNAVKKPSFIERLKGRFLKKKVVENKKVERQQELKRINETNEMLTFKKPENTVIQETRPTISIQETRPKSLMEEGLETEVIKEVPRTYSILETDLKTISDEEFIEKLTQNAGNFKDLENFLNSFIQN